MLYLGGSRLVSLLLIISSMLNILSPWALNLAGIAGTGSVGIEVGLYTSLCFRMMSSMVRMPSGDAESGCSLSSGGRMLFRPCPRLSMSGDTEVADFEVETEGVELLR
jgi:hypothetical protein